LLEEPTDRALRAHLLDVWIDLDKLYDLEIALALNMNV
jgi:hypothetical protein